MHFLQVRKISIIPASILLLFSTISIILTAAYWVLGDYFIPRGVAIPVSTQFLVDDTIVYYVETTTNATIVSGCLNLTAAAVAIFVWTKLKQQKLDTDFHAPLRRFYLVLVMVMGASGIISALIAIAFHYTEKGDDKYGCTTQVGHTFQTPAKGIPFTNLYCTREMAYCNFQAKYLSEDKTKPLQQAACNMAVTVKWFQLLLIFIQVALMGMFFFLARLRRANRNRWSLHSDAEKNNQHMQT